MFTLTEKADEAHVTLTLFAGFLTVASTLTVTVSGGWPVWNFSSKSRGNLWLIAARALASTAVSPPTGWMT